MIYMHGLNVVLRRSTLKFIYINLNEILNKIIRVIQKADFIHVSYFVSTLIMVQCLGTHRGLDKGPSQRAAAFVERYSSTSRHFIGCDFMFLV